MIEGVWRGLCQAADTAAGDDDLCSMCQRQAIFACQTGVRHEEVLRCSVSKGAGPERRERCALYLDVWLALLLAFICLL